MRIAFFADNFYPELSGIVDSILISSKELKMRGHEIVFVGPQYDEQDYTLAHRTYTKESDSEVIEGTPVVRLPSLRMPFSPTGQSHFAIPSGKAVSYVKTWKPDIIHTHSPYGCGLEALRASRALGVPLIGTNHTPIEEFFPVGKTLVRHFDAWYYNHCEQITAPFSALIERMRQVGFAKPGRALPNPVVLSVFSPPTPDEKRQIRSSLELRGPVILYAGRVAPEKHLDVVLQALPELIKTYPQLTFVITGHGSAKKDIELLAHTLGISERVRCTGFLPVEMLAQYYKAADVFTIPSTADSQSIALMQAFTCGVPAIGARAHGLPEYISPEVGFLIEPGDVAAMQKNLTTLLANESLRASMGEAARRFVATLSPERIAQEWELLYQSAIESYANRHR